SGGGTVGVIAALLGGIGMSSLFSSRADASLNTGSVDAEMPDGLTPAQMTERTLRELGIQGNQTEQKPSEIEIKVKELTFEADDIIFDADQYKFADKKGNVVGGGAAPSGGSSGGGSGGPTGTGTGSGGNTSQQPQEPKPSAGFFNGLMDKFGSGSGSS